ncbi:MAG: hypothetical protein HOQ21_10110 [Dermatophilaceae bacterium]|nr:hypothetical protein [Dermatophilaceae bacterium]
MSTPEPRPVDLSQPVEISEQEMQQLERRWRWAIKAQGNALRIVNPDGSNGGWLGRRPRWWRRAYYRVRGWLA